jgi:hypothetical protein
VAEETEGTSQSPQPASPLDKAGEFVKYLTALATGALVFSAELLKKDYVVPDTARHLILFCWVCLVFSALFGLAALARIPMMMTEGTEDLEDTFLKWPIRLQQLSLPAGIIALGVALILTLWHPPSNATESQPSACCQAVEPGPKFSIVSSAPHSLGKAPPHQHTFLLQQDTGRVWEMTCDSEKKVRFRAVQVENLDAAPQR